MTLTEGQAILSSITYKDKWRFDLRKDGLTTAATYTQDSSGTINMDEGDTLTVQRTCNFDLSHITDPKCLIEIVYNEIIWMEMHEVDEWFKINNKLWNDPHAPSRSKALEAQSCNQHISDKGGKL